MEIEPMEDPMKLIDEEKEKLQKAKDEDTWYKVCDEIKDRRNGQFPSYLAREVLQLFQEKLLCQISKKMRATHCLEKVNHL